MTRSNWFLRLALICFGGIGALALPPFHLIFVLLPAVTGLVWAVYRSIGIKDAFGTGWWFGLGHGLVGYYWISNAFLVDAENHGILAPFSVIGIAGGLAILPGLTAAATWRLCRWCAAPAITFVLIFGFVWGVSEWIRSWIFTGFTWNLVATIWTISPELLQTAAMIGPYGLGVLTIVLAGLPALFFINKCRFRASVCISIGLILSAALWFCGHLRLESATYHPVDKVRLRLIQPNIPQHLKWRQDLRASHVQKQIRLSISPTESFSPTHVIWPETAVPFDLSADYWLRKAISAVVPPGGLLITGAPRSERFEYGHQRAYNSIHAIDDKGVVAASYDKRHLVPFGEYIPLRWIFGLSKFTAGRVDFQPGKTARVFDLAGLPPVAMLICYEVIFPAEIIDTKHRPAWVLNLTNDAWFGFSAGPHQHLAAAQLRAVEQGLPVVRVANTGISAVIDAYGRLEASLPLGKEGYLDSSLPAALAEATPYGKFGDKLTLLLLLIGMAILWLAKIRDFKRFL